jgi:hypothetical protein
MELFYKTNLKNTIKEDTNIIIVQEVQRPIMIHSFIKSDPTTINISGSKGLGKAYFAKLETLRRAFPDLQSESKEREER